MKDYSTMLTFERQVNTWVEDFFLTLLPKAEEWANNNKRNFNFEVAKSPHYPNTPEFLIEEVLNDSKWTAHLTFELKEWNMRFILWVGDISTEITARFFDDCDCIILDILNVFDTEL
jgi:hypothetical protein